MYIQQDFVIQLEDLWVSAVTVPFEMQFTSRLHSIHYPTTTDLATGSLKNNVWPCRNVSRDEEPTSII